MHDIPARASIAVEQWPLASGALGFTVLIRFHLNTRANWKVFLIIKVFFAQGFYAFEDEPVKWEFPHFRVIPYGHYLFHVSIGMPNKPPSFCWKSECKTIPKVDSAKTSA